MTNIITRASKGDILTHVEFDSNFTNLKNTADAALAAATAVTAQIDERIQAVVGAAPLALDTLGEIAVQLADDETAVTALTGSVVAAQATANSRVRSVTVTGDAEGTATPDANGDLSIAITLKGDIVSNKNNVSGAVAINFANGNYVAMQTTAATTLTLSGVPDAVRAYGLTLEIKNGGTFITWPSGITWLAGAAPVLKASGINLVTLITRDGGGTWLGTST